jgi:spermidine dehydrogenase
VARRRSDDEALGLAERITRRDFLDATLLAAGGTLLGGLSPLDALAAGNSAFDGYGGVGDYATANGNTYEVLTEGHKIRDGAYAHVPARSIVDAGTFDCVVVGGGISGLAAALFFQRATEGARSCLVLEDHRMFGGLARRNEFAVGGERLLGNQASAMFFPPLPGTFLSGFYASIGIDTDTFEYQTWGGSEPEIRVGRSPYFGGGRTSAWYFGPAFGQPSGMLVVDPWGKRLEGAPLPDQARRDLLQMSERRSTRADGSLEAGTRPKEHGDAASRRLDSITLEDHLIERYGLSRETVRRFLSPVSGGGSGIGADALSAYADYAADVLLPWDYAKGSQMFPGGNTGVARHIVKSLIPDAIPGANTLVDVCRNNLTLAALDRRGQASRIRTRCTVFAVEPSPGHVRVTYSRGGKVYSARARSVIMAGGSWTTKHIVRDLPQSHRDAYAEFYRSPCLMANVALRSWRFLYDLGIHECRWFEGIGNYFAIRKMATFGPVAPTISPDSPVVLTFKILFSYPGRTVAEQTAQGRAALLTTPFREYERRLREQLTAMFGRHGFDAKRDIAGVILNRWGHAYLSPQPGFFFGKDGRPAPGDVLRTNPVGRIAFANSDVTGIMDHRASILEAHRAVKQIIDKV